MFKIFVIFMSFLAIVSYAQSAGPVMPYKVEYQGKTFIRDNRWEDKEKIESIDIDGDGRNETIFRFCVNKEGRDKPAAVTAIYKKDKPIKVIFGGEFPKSMELRDIDGDGLKDIIVYDYCGNHYTLIMVYSYENGEYKCLFENGTPCYFYKVDTEASPARITIGRENWEDEEFCYANSEDKSLKEVYQWNGKEFKYSSKLSTTKLIGEKQAIEITWQNMRKTMQPFKGDTESERLKNELVMEYTAKSWNAGTRAFELFEKECDQAKRKQKELYRKEGVEELAEINEALKSKLNTDEKSFLLCRKAYILLTSIEDLEELKDGTECLMEAVLLTPNDADCKEFLADIYREFWLGERIDGEDEDSKELRKMQKRISFMTKACYIENALKRE
ncbi:MAG: VCBS repeat-containing protein [Candidatus Omnitrophota bacterium]